MPDTFPPYAIALQHNDFIELRSTLFIGLLLIDLKHGTTLLQPDCPDSELGGAVLKALAAFRIVSKEEGDALYKLSDDEDWYGQWIEERMARFGYKRKGQLFKRLYSCTIRNTQDEFIISPSNHDQLEGWSGLGDSEDVHIPVDSTPEEIGAALRLGFSRCWGRY